MAFLQLESLVIRITADASGFNRAINDVNRQIDTLSGRVRNLGTTLTAFFTIPIAAMAASSVRSFARFDDAMVQTLSVMRGVTEAGRFQLERLAFSLSSLSTTGPTEIANGFQAMARAGYDVNHIMASMDTMNRFAIVSNRGLSESITSVNQAMAALGFNSRDAGVHQENLSRLLNMVARSSNLSGGSLEDMMSALVRAGPTIRNLNIPLEDALAVLTAFQAEGIHGTQAGQQYIQLISRMQQYGPGTGLFGAGTGIQFRGGGTGARAGGGSISMRQFRGLMALGGAFEQIEEYRRLLASPGSVLNEMFITRMASFDSQMTIMRNRVEVVAIAIGRVLVPYLQEMNLLVGKALDWWNNLPAAYQKVYIALALILAVIGPTILALRLLQMGFIQLIGTWKLLISVAGALIAPLWLISSLGTIVFGSLINGIGGFIKVLALVPLGISKLSFFVGYLAFSLSKLAFVMGIEVVKAGFAITAFLTQFAFGVLGMMIPLIWNFIATLGVLTATITGKVIWAFMVWIGRANFLSALLFTWPKLIGMMIASLLSLSVGMLVTAAGALPLFISAIGGFIASMIPAFVTAVGTATLSVLSFAVAIVGVLVKAIAMVVGWMAFLIAKIVLFIGVVVSASAPILGPLIAIGIAIFAIWAAINSAGGFQNAWNGLISGLATAWDTVMRFLVNFEENMQILMAWLDANWSTLWGDLWNIAGTLAVNGLANIGILFGRLFTIFQARWQAFWLWMDQFGGSTLNAFIGLAGTIMGNMFHNLIELWTFVFTPVFVRFVNWIIDSLVSAFRHIFTVEFVYLVSVGILAAMGMFIEMLQKFSIAFVNALGGMATSFVEVTAAIPRGPLALALALANSNARLNTTGNAQMQELEDSLSRPIPAPWDVVGLGNDLWTTAIRGLFNTNLHGPLQGANPNNINAANYGMDQLWRVITGNNPLSREAWQNIGTGASLIPMLFGLPPMVSRLPNFNMRVPEGQSPTGALMDRLGGGMFNANRGIPIDMSNTRFLEQPLNRFLLPTRRLSEMQPMGIGGVPYSGQVYATPIRTQQEILENQKQANMVDAVAKGNAGVESRLDRVIVALERLDPTCVLD